MSVCAQECIKEVDVEHSTRLNWLRAGVLGANDGIVSVAAIALGVAGATSNISTITVAATAGLIAGALSMAMGEYVSVSAQRDAEKAQHKRYGTTGYLTSAWQAAGASLLAFLLGGALPLIAVLIAPAHSVVLTVIISVVIALGITGALSAILGRSELKTALLRNVIGGGLAMLITYFIGSLLGVSVF